MICWRHRYAIQWSWKVHCFFRSQSFEGSWHVITLYQPQELVSLSNQTYYHQRPFFSVVEQCLGQGEKTLGMSFSLAKILAQLQRGNGPTRHFWQNCEGAIWRFIFSRSFSSFSIAHKFLDRPVLWHIQTQLRVQVHCVTITLYWHWQSDNTSSFHKAVALTTFLVTTDICFTQELIRPW